MQEQRLEESLDQCYQRDNNPYLSTAKDYIQSAARNAKDTISSVKTNAKEKLAKVSETYEHLKECSKI